MFVISNHLTLIVTTNLINEGHIHGNVTIIADRYQTFWNHTFVQETIFTREPITLFQQRKVGFYLAKNFDQGTKPGKVRQSTKQMRTTREQWTNTWRKRIIWHQKLISWTSNHADMVVRMSDFFRFWLDKATQDAPWNLVRIWVTELREIMYCKTFITIFSWRFKIEIWRWPEQFFLESRNSQSIKAYWIANNLIRHGSFKWYLDLVLESFN